jgi:hypothetical protein
MGGLITVFGNDKIVLGHDKIVFGTCYFFSPLFIKFYPWLCVEVVCANFAHWNMCYIHSIHLIYKYCLL